MTIRCIDHKHSSSSTRKMAPNKVRTLKATDGDQAYLITPSKHMGSLRTYGLMKIY